jgi:hypothetical protein
MRWAVVPLVLILVLLVAGPTALAATTGPTTFQAEFTPAALLGSYINGNVTGPSGSTVNVYLFGQPFNDSVYIFNETFHIPTNKTEFNLSMPTTTLTLGAYWIRANGTPPSGGEIQIYSGLIRILDPLNVTQVNEELYLLSQENLALQGQVAGLTAQISTYQFQADLLFWLFFTLFAVLLFKEGIQYYLRKFPHRLMGAREGWRNAISEPRIRTFSNMPIREAQIVTPAGTDTDRRFVTGVGDSPDQLRNREEMERYLSTYGRLEPMEGKDYWEVTLTTETTRRTREFNRRSRSFKVEL